MENRRRLKNVFIAIVVGVTVFIIYLTTEDGLEPAYKKSNSTASPLPEPKWEDPGPYHVAYPRTYRFIMDDTPTCKTSHPFLILMIPVAPADVAARDTIRRTWGSEKLVLGQLVETIFIVGLPGGNNANQQQERLRQENEQYHDIIQSNFQDGYRNLTIKTMVMLEWLVRHCNTPVLRNPFNRFYMPRYVVPEPEYPPYPLGMAYIMSLDLPKKILTVSPQIKPIYIEDAYLGMCLKRLGISPTDPPDKQMFQVNPWHPLSSCDLSKVIAMTTTHISQIQMYWQRIRWGVQC
ncbi:hypothetical protein GOODEAATRI_026501 [Goodea atripinnis]|uniref:Hexosyltransferase n=1 Tax=Goodea atripinnis TaxID=208336 RepID=A0ABV0PRU3_9TELE